MSSSSNVAPVQRSRKFDSTAPVVPSKYLMNSEPRLSNFDAPRAASQRVQQLKRIPHEVLSGMPTLSRDKDFESMKEESAGRSADERESISNEMCRMLQTHVSSVVPKLSPLPLQDQESIPCPTSHCSPEPHTPYGCLSFRTKGNC